MIFARPRLRELQIESTARSEIIRKWRGLRVPAADPGCKAVAPISKSQNGIAWPVLRASASTFAAICAISLLKLSTGIAAKTASR
jgi:hypothetical protein